MGATWGDQTPPFWQFLLRDGHTADACSDPTATFDSKGNAYTTTWFDMWRIKDGKADEHWDPATKP